MDDAKTVHLCLPVGMNLPMSRRAQMWRRSKSVRACGASSGADLGGSSNYSSSILEDWSGEWFRV